MIKWFEKNWRLSVGILIFGFVLIFYISSLEFSTSSVGFGWKTIAYHFLAFFVLELFLLICLVRGKRKQNFVFALLIGILYSLSDELHQFLVPGRACSLGDVFVDTLGIFCAGIFYLASRPEGFQAKV
ncbi:MAG: VanZ family protein [Nanoarchaeota archaeon]|nr:VanZ family protein [Nanoarchaeota archaeon]